MNSTTSTTRTTSRIQRHTVRGLPRPWWRWLLIALVFPIAGEIGHLIAGRVDSVWAAVLGGVVTGAGLGAGQWMLLRHRGVSVRWIPTTAVGLGVGLAIGAPLVSYRTDMTSLVVMGAVSGLGVGVAQGAMLKSIRRVVLWTAATAALWALGWAATTAGGISVDQQFVVFGAYGAITVAFLQSIFIGAFIPAKAAQS